MDIKKFAVNPTTRLHLCDASEDKMYTEDGKPIAVNLFGPGSKQYSKAQAAQSNRMVDKLKRKGKTSQTAEEKTEEGAKFLTACTESWENLEYDKLTGDELSMAVYSDITLGFIADQVSKELGDWSNFTQKSIES